ncbi:MULTISPECIES: F0F1 ATP synthase subunit epsilon [unclassified Halomonas]|uniref:F0F1 ATP synthase subunit epsilon n=1 Tax=unclassified Halomonas TaxID=2609666 RepID=UPI000B5B2E76|nr:MULTISPECIES: F0F1 ATP synthase subunit epsilon [unclassified Halomonas]ASK18064.1 ATPase [Halomonas sp. N3-2A]MCD6003846.1 F0F1 ATP synthase subunit epsilon [Halomonas sp. IOP_6]UTD55460.1 F0F1 ATP synthase subunit epsilon [Halomonas sp. MS1]
MSQSTMMQVTLRLPAMTLHQGPASRLFAVAENGAFGMLPNHIDFVTALVPSVLILTLADGEEQIFGIDEGILVKKGHQVEIAIRRGVQGTDLASLKETVQRNFIEVDEDERVARSALARLEAGMVRRFADLQRPKTP